MGRPKKGEERTWSHSTGTAKHNRVRVYERTPGGPIWIEYRVAGRLVRRSLSTLTAAPVLDRTVARAVAEKVAAHLRVAETEEQLLTTMGVPKDRTLAALLDAFHKGNPQWEGRHLTDCLRWRRRYMDALGADRRIHTITASDVQRAVTETVGSLSASQRAKMLKYLRKAFKFAIHTLRWLPITHELTGLTIPAQSPNRGKAFSDDELDAIARELPGIDLRAAFIQAVQESTGQRTKPLRLLRVRDCRRVTLQDQLGGVVTTWQITLIATHTKDRRENALALTERPAQLLDRLMETPAVRATGLVCPGGNLADAQPTVRHRRKVIPRRAIDHGKLVEFWREAERRAGVESIPSRAFHGVKRTVTTRATSAGVPLGILSATSGTTVQTLSKDYDKTGENLGAKLAGAQALTAARTPRPVGEVVIVPAAPRDEEDQP